MNQMVRMWVMFAILLAIGIYAALSASDEPPVPAPTVKSTAKAKTQAPTPSPLPPVERQAKATPAALTANDAALPELEPDAAPPQGPFVYALGTHSILLKGEGRRFLTVEVELVMDSAAGRDEVRRRRRHLVRMLYFLCSKRQADGTDGSEGKARLKADLRERFGNAIKSGNIRELNFLKYEIESRPRPDAGTE